MDASTPSSPQVKGEGTGSETNSDTQPTAIVQDIQLNEAENNENEQDESIAVLEVMWDRLPEGEQMNRVINPPTSTNAGPAITLQSSMVGVGLPHITEETERAINMSLLASSSIEDIPPPKADYNAPPPYEVVTQTTKLPTYEEVQREKHLEEELLGVPIVNHSSQFRTPPNQRILLPIDNEATEDVDTSLLGTDFMFYIAFFVAFIFNWIGFLLLMCFCHTIASRYGALSGFGLSLAKWTFIVQHSTDLASKDNSWLWWLIMTFGLIICIRAILQYLNIKRGWHMLSASHQERLLFFY